MRIFLLFNNCKLFAKVKPNVKNLSIRQLSIRQYLFILIGAILLGIAALQLVLISVFKQHLNQEVEQKSKLLSTRIIDLAVQQVNLDDPSSEAQPSVQIKHLSALPHSKEPKIIEIEQQGDCKITRHFKSDEKQEAISVKLECDDEQIHGSSEQTYTIVDAKSGEQAPAQVHSKVFKTVLTDQQHHAFTTDQRIELRQKLHKIIEQTHNSQNFNTYAFIGNGEREFETVQNSNNAVDTLTNYMIYLVIASSIVALIIAMWLSHHFTHPLRKLANGFEQLEKGDFGVQVQSHGIGEYQKTLNSFNQMSEQLKALAESEKALQQQAHLAELGEVSRGLAHALRNPMHTIGLSVEQLKDPSLPEKTKAKMHTRIQAKIDHIDKTIKALLTLTAGEISRNDQVPLKAVLQDICLEMKANSADVTIDLNCANDITPTVTGSESEIRAILHTLVVNAVEANLTKENSQGNNKGTVTININQNERHLNVEVIDQGSGIEPSIKDKLFEPHVSSKAEGAGMGLYIAKRLATLYYGGTLTLENHQSGGCIAQVNLSTNAQPKSTEGESHE